MNIKTANNNNNNTLYQQAFSKNPSEQLLNELNQTNQGSGFDMAYSLDLSPEARAQLAKATNNESNSDGKSSFNSTIAFLSAIDDNENRDDPFSASLQTTADLLNIINGTKRF